MPKSKPFTFPKSELLVDGNFLAKYIISSKSIWISIINDARRMLPLFYLESNTIPAEQPVANVLNQTFNEMSTFSQST